MDIGLTNKRSHSVGHLLETSVAVLVSVLNQLFILTIDTDGFKVVEFVVCKGIRHTVAANDLVRIVKGVVSVGDVGKLGAVRILAGNLSGSAGVVILVGSLVAESVGYFLVTRGVAVNRISGLVKSSVFSPFLPEFCFLFSFPRSLYSYTVLARQPKIFALNPHAP